MGQKVPGSDRPRKRSGLGPSSVGRSSSRSRRAEPVLMVAYATSTHLVEAICQELFYACFRDITDGSCRRGWRIISTIGCVVFAVGQPVEASPMSYRSPSNPTTPAGAPSQTGPCHHVFSASCTALRLTFFCCAPPATRLVRVQLSILATSSKSSSSLS